MKSLTWRSFKQKEGAIFDVKKMKAGSAQIRNYSSSLVLQDRELPSGALIPEK